MTDSSKKERTLVALGARGCTVDNCGGRVTKLVVVRLDTNVGDSAWHKYLCVVHAADLVEHMGGGFVYTVEDV